MSINWEDLTSNSLSELKNEAHRLNIDTPPRITKKQLVELLSKRVEPQVVSSKLFNQSSENSQSASQNHSSRQSPTPQELYRSNQTVLNTPPHSNRTEKITPNQISLENTFQQGEHVEKREQSPVLPSSSSKHKSQTSSHKKSHQTTDERKVRYSNTSSHHSVSSTPLTRVDNYQVPKNYIVMNYLSASLVALFAIMALVVYPLLIIFALVNLVIYIIVHKKLNNIKDKKARSLSSKIVAYLENECQGSAYRSHLKEKFNADTYVMRRAASILTSKKRIGIKERKDKDQVWTLTK